MPIYEYACNKCGQEFETLVRSGTVPDCPSCHSTKLEKKLSVFASSSSAGAADACSMSPTGKRGGCGNCCGGGPHRH